MDPTEGEDCNSIEIRSIVFFLFYRGKEKSAGNRFAFKLENGHAKVSARCFDAWIGEMERTWGLGDDRKCKFDVRHVIL